MSSTVVLLDPEGGGLRMLPPLRSTDSPQHSARGHLGREEVAASCCF